MKTSFQPLFLPIAAALLIVSLSGCKTSPTAADDGPNAKTVALSTMQTFDIYGTRDDKGMHPLKDGPAPDAVTQAVRESVEARGYRYQTDAPDFYVVISWQKSLQQSPTAPANPLVAPTPGPSPAPSYNSLDLNIVARDRVTDQVLWWSPVMVSAEAQTVTELNARTLAQNLLKDFPPTQAAISGQTQLAKQGN